MNETRRNSRGANFLRINSRADSRAVTGSDEATTCHGSKINAGREILSCLSPGPRRSLLSSEGGPPIASLWVVKKNFARIRGNLAIRATRDISRLNSLYFRDSTNVRIV